MPNFGFINATRPLPISSSAVLEGNLTTNQAAACARSGRATLASEFLIQLHFAARPARSIGGAVRGLGPHWRR